MQKIRKLLRVVSEKTFLLTNQPTNQPIITNNTNLAVPGWGRPKKIFEVYRIDMNLVWDFLSFKKNANLVGHEEVAYQRLTKIWLVPIPNLFWR